MECPDFVSVSALSGETGTKIRALSGDLSGRSDGIKSADKTRSQIRGSGSSSNHDCPTDQTDELF